RPGRKPAGVWTSGTGRPCPRWAGAPIISRNDLDPLRTRHPGMERTPASLLERLRGSADPGAWARFVELYTPLLFSWTRRLGRQEAEGADLARGVRPPLLHRLRGLEYDRRKRFRGWLWAVLRNHWATRKRAEKITARGGPGELPEPAVDGGAE